MRRVDGRMNAAFAWCGYRGKNYKPNEFLQKNN